MIKKTFERAQIEFESALRVTKASIMSWVVVSYKANAKNEPWLFPNTVYPLKFFVVDVTPGVIWTSHLLIKQCKQVLIPRKAVYSHNKYFKLLIHGKKCCICTFF